MAVTQATAITCAVTRAHAATPTVVQPVIVHGTAVAITQATATSNHANNTLQQILATAITHATAIIHAIAAIIIHATATVIMHAIAAVVIHATATVIMQAIIGAT